MGHDEAQAQSLEGSSVLTLEIAVREMNYKHKVSRRQITQHKMQNTTIAIIRELILRINTAKQINALSRPILRRHFCDQLYLRRQVVKSLQL